MGTFSSELVVQVLPNGLEDQLVTPLIWTSYNGMKIEVPVGFVTDYASVPRVFWAILPPSGKYTKAAVLHDWLYVMKPVARSEADGYLREAMTDCGVDFVEREVIYRQVRWWGWVSWWKDKALFEKNAALVKIAQPVTPKGPVVVNPSYTGKAEGAEMPPDVKTEVEK